MGEVAIRRQVLNEVADAVPVADAPDAVLVAIDGVDGSGKTTFADDLATVVTARGRPVVRIHGDDFLNVSRVRYRRGRDSPEGFWRDSVDLDSLRREVLDPLGPGGHRWYRWAVTDVSADERLALPAQLAPPSAVVVVDGLFLHRDELSGAWAYSVFLDVPFEVTAGRMAQRDGTPADPEHPRMRRYVHGQQLYFASCAPWRRADLVIDNTDVDHPTITRGGSR